VCIAHTIDTIDHVHGIGNMPTHSIENVLFQRARSSPRVLIKFESLSRSSKLTGTGRAPEGGRGGDCPPNWTAGGVSPLQLN
jgi:hypothetical protein